MKRDDKARGRMRQGRSAVYIWYVEVFIFRAKGDKQGSQTPAAGGIEDRWEMQDRPVE